MFCLLVVLAKLSVLAKWLARKTPLRKPNRGEGIICRKPRPKTAHDFLCLLYCFIVLLCICVVYCPYVIYYPTVMAPYGLFVLKVLLNPKQANKQTTFSIILSFNKIQNGDIPVPANPGPPGKWLLKWREIVLCDYGYMAMAVTSHNGWITYLLLGLSGGMRSTESQSGFYQVIQSLSLTWGTVLASEGWWEAW